MGTVENFDPHKPLQTEGYVCNKPGGQLKLQKVMLPPLLGTQVQVNIMEAGLCNTDIHMRDNDWGTSDYPLVLGHEGVGIVTHLGDSVRRLKIGDRVGIAWIRDGCLNCRHCHEGRENICESGYQGTYLGESSGMWGKSPLKYNEMGGCYTKIQRIEERFAVKIPESISNSQVCPLLCGGATVYEPLLNYAPAGVGTRVGFIGFGGVGRCGVKLAKLRGSYTIVISSTESKRKAALHSGADEFWCMTDSIEEKKKRGAGPGLDLIVDTRPSIGISGDLTQVMSTLRNDGVYCRVGIPPARAQGLHYIWIPTVYMQHSITGSAVTGSKRLNELLHVCDTSKDIMFKGDEVFEVRVLPFDKINEAMDSLSSHANDDYRYILKW